MHACSVVWPPRTAAGQALLSMKFSRQKYWRLFFLTLVSMICWIIEKAREFQKNIYFCFIDYAKAFDCVDHNKLGKILKEMGIPDHLTFLLRNLYADQAATVRTGHGTAGWFQIGKGVCQGCILSPCLFNLYRVHHVKYWAGWITCGNQNCQEKCQKPQIMQIIPL